MILCEMWGAPASNLGVGQTSLPCLVSFQTVANLSACGQVDSEALVHCLRDKSEEEILAINKVGLNGHGCGGREPIGVG